MFDKALVILQGVGFVQNTIKLMLVLTSIGHVHVQVLGTFEPALDQHDLLLVAELLVVGHLLFFKV